MVSLGGIAPRRAGLGIARNCACVILIFFSAAAVSAQSNSELASQPIAQEIQHRALQYFLDNANPQTGQVLDKACNFSSTCPEAEQFSHIASLAATGFGLAVITNASTRAWVTNSFAKNYALKTIKFVSKHVLQRHGWFI